ncbi:MAG: amidohydrolase [Desulfobacterales bacterium]|nr:amidohydrolase [Desulfobacterales bacterium]
MKKKIYINADVVTMDSTESSAGAFGILGDRFAVTGSEEKVRHWGGPDAQCTDLKGRTVLPGFIETHNHLSYFSLRMDHADCSTPPNTGISQVLDRLKAIAKETPEEEWVFGWGFDDSLISDKRHLNRDELDNVSGKHHLVITHTSGHLGYVNSRVLEKMGIDDTTPDPEGGEIHRDSSGRATGLLKETALFPIMGLIPKPDTREIKELLVRGIAIANANGVTGIHDAAIGMEGSGTRVVRAYRELAREGRLNLRAYLTLMNDLYDRYHDLGIGTGFGSDTVKLGSVKLFQDGSIQGHTGWLSRPYHDRLDTGHVSQPIMSQKALDALVEKYHGAGLQVAVHGNGDAAIDSIIQAFEKAQKNHPRKDPRHLLIHCQTVREDQIPRMKACGLMPSYFVQHIHYWGDRHHDIFLGPERAARISPLASSLARGLKFTLHSDLPVTPMEPLHSIHTAVNRTTREGRTLGPDQRISPLDALKAYTTWAAMAAFDENTRGSITPGKLADWVVVSDNPLSVPADKIKDIQVLETIMGGKRVYIR